LEYLLNKKTNEKEENYHYYGGTSKISN